MRTLSVIQSGTIHLNEGDDAALWTEEPAQYIDESGTALRSFRTSDIQFPRRFEGGAPTVVLSIAGLGVLSGAGDSNFKIKAVAEDVQPEEFNIRVETFGNASVHSFAIAWVAHD